MNNININNTLAELEDNLKKMDSARSQVSNLSQLVSQLTEAYADTLGQLKKIESSIHYDEKYFEKKFGKSINELDANINLLQSKVVDHNNSVNSIHEKASKDFINSLKKSEEKVKLYIDDIKPTLEKVQTEFKNKNEEIIVDLKQKIKEVIETSSEKINEIKSLDLLKEINSIESTTKEINSNFENVFSSLHNIQNTQHLNFENILYENEVLKTEINSNFEKIYINFIQVLHSVNNIEKLNKINFDNIQNDAKEIKSELQIIKKEIKAKFDKIDIDFGNTYISLDNICKIIGFKYEKIQLENKELKDEIQNLRSNINSKFKNIQTNFKILLVAIVITLLAIVVIKFV